MVSYDKNFLNTTANWFCKGLYNKETNYQLHKRRWQKTA